MRRWIGLALLLGIVGCSAVKDVPAATQAIGTFHAALNRGDFTGIYGSTTTAFRGATTQDHFAGILTAMHRKLGAFRSGKVLGWNDNFNTAGHFVSVNYSATYDRGQASESFVFTPEAGRMRLNGFNVNSDALILN